VTTEINLRATGTFDIVVNRQPPYDTVDGVSLGRTTIDKRFTGDLEATSKVEMLTAGAPESGSAGYVAIERVVGALEGRKGSFVLQHNGTMTRGQPSLAVSVVPGSGTGALTGIAGRMTIEIVDGQHRFAFDYALEEPA
jgi:hypothetical protein